MTITEIVLSGGGGLILLLSLIQIAPININPWSSILGWIGKEVNKELLAQMKRMQSEIDTIRDENREVHAKECRVRILRFADEIYLGTPHSQEHFKQVLGDITQYEQYCDIHPKFENQIAVAAIEQIKENYNTRLRQHDFLQ